MRTGAKLRKAFCLKIIIANNNSHFKDFFRKNFLEKIPTHRPTKSPTQSDPTRLSKSRFSKSPTRPDFQYRWSVPTLAQVILEIKGFSFVFRQIFNRFLDVSHQILGNLFKLNRFL